MSNSLRWFKSSYSSDSGGECVEVAACPHTIRIRDSKQADGPTFAVTPTTWANFVDWAS